jgi:sarcosine oxidase subunit gamma
MLDTRSTLGDLPAFEHGGLRIAEAPDFSLTQIAGDEKDLKKALGKLPDFGSVAELEGALVFRIAPAQVWVLGAQPSAKGCYLTPLSSGRSRFVVEGEGARGLLAACAAVDFSAATSTPGTYAMTGIHHVPVLIHCVAENAFHIYVMRSFALSTWEWLCDAAVGWPAVS